MPKKTAIEIAHEFIFSKEMGKEDKKKYLNKEGWEIYNDFGKPAVGPGVRLQNLPEEYREMKVGERIPENVVDDAFEKQLVSISNNLTKEFGDVYSGFNPDQQASTISLVYNVGMEGFKTGGKEGRITKAYTALKEGDISIFAKESFDPVVGFVKSGGKVIEGLQTRRKEEGRPFVTKKGDGVKIAMESWLKEERSMIG